MQFKGHRAEKMCCKRRWRRCGIVQMIVQMLPLLALLLENDLSRHGIARFSSRTCPLRAIGKHKEHRSACNALLVFLKCQG